MAATCRSTGARAEVTFGYHGRARVLRPYGIINRNGFWYLVGFDTGYGEQRTYRVDRIEGDVAAGSPAAFTRPADFDIESSVPTDPKTFGNGASEHAIVRVDAKTLEGIHFFRRALVQQKIEEATDTMIARLSKLRM